MRRTLEIYKRIELWMKKWTSKVRRVIKEEGRGRGSINLAIVSSNNHYAGFGPGTANIFRRMVGLPEAIWSKENKKEEDGKSYLHNRSSNVQQPDHNSNQSTLSDFMT